ncbi:hypothetical protein D6745_00570 [Candidatus Woesearchaeota archaeon]|nr:MAG: hypothetical protein D6745_00570 [Candidatus Woesearchaeota archaeon]
MVMVKVPYEDIIAKIEEEKGIGKEEIESKIKAKLNQLSGLISKEGAAHIIANELGVNIFPQTSGKLKIKNILPGIRNLETVGRVAQIFEVRSFNSGSRSGKVGSFMLGDETGKIRVVLWNDQVDKLSSLKENMIIKIAGAYVKENNGRKEIHLNDMSKLILNPEGETVPEIQLGSARQRKKISELTENDENIEILGTIVQVFDMKFFEVCPQCNRRTKPREEGFVCNEHGKIEPAYSYLLNLFIDDGSDSIRTVFFRNQVQSLTGKTNEEILAGKDDSSVLEPVKMDLLGKIIKVVGRVNKNEMFERLELVANLVDPNPNPDQEIKRLQEEIKQKEESSAEEQPIEPSAEQKEDILPVDSIEPVDEDKNAP